MKKMKKFAQTEQPKFKLFSIRSSVYMITLIIAVLCIYFGNQFVTSPSFQPTNSQDTTDYQIASVQQVYSTYTSSQNDAGGNAIPSKTVTFSARILKGINANEMIVVKQKISNATGGKYVAVTPGKQVIVYSSKNDAGNTVWAMSDYARLNYILYLGAALFVLLIIFGRTKGFNTILTLALTCGAVFWVFVPSIISGFNIYMTSLIVCVFVVLVSILLLYGPSKKSFVAAIGCFGGLAAAATITYFMQDILRLTGNVNDTMTFLTLIGGNDYIDLNAIIFASIIIGALGAVMDVSISIASSVSEIALTHKKRTVASLTKSGFNIGRDIMGAMANTLVLAYIGSALPVIIVFMAMDASHIYTLNREMIIVDLLQAVVGSIGILLTIPLTTFVAASVFARKGGKGRVVNTTATTVKAPPELDNRVGDQEFIDFDFHDNNSDIEQSELHAKVDEIINEEPKKRSKRKDYLDHIDEIAAEENAAGNTLFSKKDD